MVVNDFLLNNVLCRMEGLKISPILLAEHLSAGGTVESFRIAMNVFENMVKHPEDFKEDEKVRNKGTKRASA